MKIWLVLLLVFSGPVCTAAQAPQPKQEAGTTFVTEVAAERIENLDALKAKLKQYHECICACGCYAHDTDAQADRAIAFLRQRAAHRRAGEKLALILDIDETTLSNYAEIVGADFAYDPKAFNAWIDTAQAPAIAGTLRLYKEAQQLGVKIFFITGRNQAQRQATERNLRAQGFDNWQGMDLRPVDHGAQTVGEFKAAMRARIVAQGYTLAANVGDQWSDLRGRPEAEFNVKYPDPFYYIP